MSAVACNDVQEDEREKGAHQSGNRALFAGERGFGESDDGARIKRRRD
ncbi:hypothetical protein Q1M64_14400 (plasmid) [Sinorhizobium meliloti]|nr:hypothetical protein Q1M64_14400 [Sinorhizobium meliloti]